MKRQRTIAFVAVIGCWFFTEALVESRQCCDNGIHIQPHRNACQDGKIVAVDCNGSSSELRTELYRPEQYVLESDSEGEYLDLYQEGLIVREPNFCEGTLLYGSDTVAIICSNAKTPTPQYETTAEQEDSETETIAKFSLQVSNLFRLANLMIFSPISFICLIVMVILYNSIREVQDAEGSCIFHLALNLAVVHAIATCIPYLRFSDSFLNLQQLTTFAAYAWAIALSISTWCRFRKNSLAAESQLKKHYLYLAYVFAIGVFTIIHVLNAQLFEPIFIVVIFFTIGFFSVLLQKRIHYYQSANLSGANSLLRIAKFRLRLFGILYLILGLPQILLHTLFIIINNMRFGSQQLPLVFTHHLITSFCHLEGVWIFLLLVIYRPRMRKAIASGYCANCKSLPARWRTEEDPEDVQQNNGIDMLNRHRTFMDYQTEKHSEV